MSKKSKAKRSQGRSAPPAPVAVSRLRTRRFRYYAAALCALVLLTGGYAATRHNAVRLAVGMQPLVASPAPQQTPLPLAKEYVYAGGRLVATEEPQPTATPTPTPAGPAPSNLVATATSTSAVHLAWDTASGAIGYVVERRSTLGGQPDEIPTNSSTPSFNDTVPPGDHSYLYRVKAVYTGGYSLYGNYDLATTVPFTDATLQGAVIKADHLKELRRAVQAVRTLAGKSAPSWTHADPVSTPASARRAVYLADVSDLRTQVDEALTGLDTALSVQTFFKPYPAEPALAGQGRVYAAHFEQIRERVK